MIDVFYIYLFFTLLNIQVILNGNTISSTSSIKSWSGIGLWIGIETASLINLLVLSYFKKYQWNFKRLLALILFYTRPLVMIYKLTKSFPHPVSVVNLSIVKAVISFFPGTPQPQNSFLLVSASVYSQPP